MEAPPAKAGSLLIGDLAVTKRFSDPGEFARELQVYRLGLPMVPALVSYREPSEIVLAKIDGQPYLDSPLATPQFALLGKTIARFHLATLASGLCLCHWDNQPRNILLCGDEFFLIDFADSRLAPPEDDLTHLLLFWAGEFALQPLNQACSAFLPAYHSLVPIDPALWPASLQRASARFDARRSQFRRRPSRLSEAQTQANREFLRDLRQLA